MHALFVHQPLVICARSSDEMRLEISVNKGGHKVHLSLIRYIIVKLCQDSVTLALYFEAIKVMFYNVKLMFVLLMDLS